MNSDGVLPADPLDTTLVTFPTVTVVAGLLEGTGTPVGRRDADGL